jgi:hypothetical protein
MCSVRIAKDKDGNRRTPGTIWASSTTQANSGKILTGNNVGTQSVIETLESAKPAQLCLKITFWLDVTLLASVCALQTVSFTGLVLTGFHPRLQWLTGKAIHSLLFSRRLLTGGKLKFGPQFSMHHEIPFLDRDLLNHR